MIGEILVIPSIKWSWTRRSMLFRDWDLHSLGSGLISENYHVPGKEIKAMKWCESSRPIFLMHRSTPISFWILFFTLIETLKIGYQTFCAALRLKGIYIIKNSLWTNVLYVFVLLTNLSRNIKCKFNTARYRTSKCYVESLIYIKSTIYLCKDITY